MIKNQFYFSRYLKFIKSCSESNHFGYTEKHHIIPKSLGGSDKTENIVVLSGRQHFIAHWMLWKAYQNNKMMLAFWSMQMGVDRNFKVSSKTYDMLKQQHAQFQSLRMTLNNPMHHIESRKKLSDTKTGSIMSIETKHKLSQLLKGKSKTEETKKRMSIASKGKPKSVEHRANMALNHCDISGKNNPMYGRSIAKENNLKWYTDGINNKFISEGTQYDGWYRGRTIKKNSS